MARHRTQPVVGIRSDLRRDRRRLRLCRRDSRRLVAPGGGLCDIAAHRHAAGAGGAAGRSGCAPACARLHPSFGPRRSVRVGGL